MRALRANVLTCLRALRVLRALRALQAFLLSPLPYYILLVRLIGYFAEDDLKVILAHNTDSSSYYKKIKNRRAQQILKDILHTQNWAKCKLPWKLMQSNN